MPGVEIDKAEKADFAKQCIAAYDVARGLVPLGDGGQPEEDVRHVACGLAVLSELADAHLKTMKSSADLPGSGLRDAKGIIDHLLTGRAHPIARRIEGLKSARFRGGAVKKNAIDETAQMVAVAVVRAYAQKAGRKQAAARRDVVAKAASAGIRFKVDGLKNWHDDFHRERSASGRVDSGTRGEIAKER